MLCRLLALLPLLSGGVVPSAAKAPPHTPAKFNGVCYASWASAGADSYDSTASDASLALAAQSGINTVAIVQTWYMADQNSTTIAASDAKSNTDAGLARAIGAARQRGLRVALKPHVDFLADDAHWRGQIGPAFGDAEWAAWFASYGAYMLRMAALARAHAADLFVVGTELSTTEPREAEWRALLTALRAAAGPAVPFVYGANWSPGPAAVPFWDAAELDFIGVDAYYPLATAAGASRAQLAAAWAASPRSGDIVAALGALSAKHGKPVIFAEIGYTTTDACAVGNHAGGAISLTAQATAYQAFFDAVYGQPWLAGVFWWDWSTNPHDGGRCDGGAFSFTPAGKPAEAVMQARFAGNATSAAAAAAAAARPPRWAAPPLPFAGGGGVASVGGAATTTTAVYSDGKLSSGWSDWSYNGKCNLRDTAQAFGNHTYSAYGNFSNWGAMSFKLGSRPLRTADYSSLSLRVHSSAASTDQVQVALYGTADASHPFSPQFLAHYVAACTLPADGWVSVTVPLADLLPPAPAPGAGADAGIAIDRLELKANYATGVGEFWVDDLSFGGGPSAPTPAPPPPTPPPPTPAGCPDVAPPPAQYTCAQQKSWGKCDTAANPWMAGFCCKTCFDCDPKCGRS